MATLALKETIAAHRPQLKVRHISIDIEQPGSIWTIEAAITGTLVVVNSGGTSAKITASGFRIYFGDGDLPMIERVDTKRLPFIDLGTGPLLLAAGDSRLIPFSALPGIAPGHENDIIVMKSADADGMYMYIFGHIQYHDLDGNARFMGFCRRWSGRGTFAPGDNPEYEYSD